jgi:Fe-S-cluster containining protein
MSWHIRRKTRLHGILLEQPLDDDPRCTGCDGACCRGFPSVELAWEEYERLHTLGATRLVLPLVGPPLLLIDFCCEFLVNNRCAIYDERPGICRRFSCEEKE